MCCSCVLQAARSRSYANISIPYVRPRPWTRRFLVLTPDDKAATGRISPQPPAEAVELCRLPGWEKVSYLHLLTVYEDSSMNMTSLGRSGFHGCAQGAFLAAFR